MVVLSKSLLCRLFAGILCVLSSFSSAFGQGHAGIDEYKLHKITVGVGHVYFAKSENEIRNHTLGAYLLNYDFIINKYWSIGSHNDILIEESRVYNEKEHTYLTEQERPLVTKVVGSFSPIRHAHLMFGIGDEITRLHNYLILNMGVDYGIHLSGGWELGGEINYDNKVQGSDTWIIGLGLSKLIGRHHKE
jgi:hypothetical protein